MTSSIVIQIVPKVGEDINVINFVRYLIIEVELKPISASITGPMEPINLMIVNLAKIR